MTTYGKIRELVKLAREMKAMGHKAYAEECRVKALWLAGRVTDAGFREYLKG